MTENLPPTQYMILEVLAARHRLGEQAWTFPTRLTPQLRALEAAGFIEAHTGITQNTMLARLTDAGRAAALSESYSPWVGQHRVAVTVFATVGPCLADEAGTIARMILRKQLWQLAGEGGELRQQHVKGDLTMRLHHFEETGMAHRGGYLWTEPTGRAFPRSKDDD